MLPNVFFTLIGQCCNRTVADWLDINEGRALLGPLTIGIKTVQYPPMTRYCSALSKCCKSHRLYSKMKQIMTSMVKKDTAKLTRRDKLERVLSEAPELPSLLAELKAHLGTLTEKVQPLVSNVTADLGASEDGLMYLRTRQQLLLAFCMNVCFYMVLKVKHMLDVV